MSLAGVSKHLKVLEGAGLVVRRTEGRTTICTLRAAPLGEAEAWVRRYERFWEDALDRLQQILHFRHIERVFLFQKKFSAGIDGNKRRAEFV